jgi:hypothetical protein
LGEAARNADAIAEEYGLEMFCKQQEVKLEDLRHVSEQRALRAAMILDGASPSDLSELSATKSMKKIQLSPEIEALLPALMAASLDGLCIGLATRSYSGFFGKGAKRS